MLILDGIMPRNLVTTWLLQFAATLDRICYSVFGWILQVIFDIANSEIVSETVFESFEDRVYIILGIFMLFKITIALLGYLVNPDQLADKEKGMGKMITRTVLVLIMLIGFPVVFRFLNDIQQPLLEALPRIIIGKRTDSEALGGQMTEVSDEISWQLFQISLGEGEADIMMGNGINTVTGATQLVTEPESNDKSTFKYFYIPFVGMIIAIVSTVLLVGIAIDVAIRAFKLIILRMMAPIPIISYIDPKSSKDGAFASWVKAITSTWLDLFIKLGILYFVIYLLDYVIIQGNLRVVSNIGPFRNTMVVIFLIIGLLFFAKQAPKFITDALGIKSKESGSLFGGLAKVAAAGAIGLGAIGSGLAAGKASYLADTANGKKHNAGNVIKNAAAGLFGGVTGAATGAGAALSAKDHVGKAAFDAMNKRNAQMLAMGAAGSTFGGRAASSLQSFLTGQNAADIGKKKIEDLEDFNKSLDNIGNRVKSEMVKSDKTSGEFIKNSGMMFNYKEFMAAKNAAASTGATRFNVRNRRTGNYEQVSMEAAEMYGGYLLKNNEDDYIKQTVSDADFDQTLHAQIADAESKAVRVSDTNITDAYYPGGTFTISGRDSVKKTQDAITRDVISEKRANAKAEADARFSHKK
ncbi:MAG TPA: hypothetical protein IAB56_05765 [Candidatus Scybalousia intestinigallinarum]|nr:hypothetical protein [Candidatus Scybalousia intestinigallinarum]